MTDKLIPHILPIVTYPDERLHQECEDVTEFGHETDQLLLDMFATMQAKEGVGLAAPQVGVMKNVLVVQLFVETDQPEGTADIQITSGGETTTPNRRVVPGPRFALFNPRLVEAGDEMYKFEEGCLSVPGYYEYRERPNRIVVAFQDEAGYEREFEFTGLMAFVIQHEMDHLKGKLFVDELSNLKKGRIRDKIKKALRRS